LVALPLPVVSSLPLPPPPPPPPCPPSVPQLLSRTRPSPGLPSPTLSPRCPPLRSPPEQTERTGRRGGRARERSSGKRLTAAAERRREDGLSEIGAGRTGAGKGRRGRERRKEREVDRLKTRERARERERERVSQRHRVTERDKERPWERGEKEKGLRCD
jgi:hypothetical protein